MFDIFDGLGNRYSPFTQVSGELVELSVVEQTLTEDYFSVYDPSLPYPVELSYDHFPGSNVRYGSIFYSYWSRPSNIRVIGARLWIPEDVVETEVTFGLLPVPAEPGNQGYSWTAEEPLTTATANISGSGWVTALFEDPQVFSAHDRILVYYVLGDGTAAIWVDGVYDGYVLSYTGREWALSEDYMISRSIRYDMVYPPDYAAGIPQRMYGLDLIAIEETI